MATHLVVPGQIIAEGDDFLRGHGTFVETEDDGVDRLIASVAGQVERVNKLVSVIPVSSSLYQGQVGDLIVGRVREVQSSRWKIQIATNGAGRDAQLPLSAVHLPGGVQRIRTQEDSRDMRRLFQEGDLVSAEVHNLHHSDGTIILHTRSLRYGKLENGCLVKVTPALIARRKNHFVQLRGMTLLLGNNGYIWIQRALPLDDAMEESAQQLSEHQEKVKAQHAATPVLTDERTTIARLRNSISCLQRVYMMITPEHIETVFDASKNLACRDMLHPANVIELTRGLRSQYK